MSLPLVRERKFSGSLLRVDDVVARDIGYEFRDRALLERALTHCSALGEGVDRWKSNERLEFLGDAALGSIISKCLYSWYPDRSEGGLTELKSALVSEEACYRYATVMGLEKWMHVGRQVAMRDEKVRRRVLADGFESLLGAIFYEGGYEAAKRFFLEKSRDEVLWILQNPPVNWKQRLQERLQREFGSLPVYSLEGMDNFQYMQSFRMAVCCCDVLLGRGEGLSKKEAEKEAARCALEALDKGLAPRISSFEGKGALDVKVERPVSALSELRRLMEVHERISQLVQSVNLQELSPEERAFLQSVSQIPPPRKKISPAQLEEGKRKLLPVAKRGVVDLASLSLRMSRIFERIYRKDFSLTVHFFNETLNDQEVVVLCRLLESNDVLHQLYLRSLSIGEVGLKALKNLLLFNRTLSRLEISYPLDMQEVFFRMAYDALKMDHNKKISLVALRANWYPINDTLPVILNRPGWNAPFDLRPLEGYLKRGG